MGNANPKLYWQIIDKLKKTQGKDLLANYINADDWVTHFKDLYLQSFSDNSLNDEITKLEEDSQTSSLNNAITINEVKMSIRKLKNNKACGEDLILNEMIKSGSSIILPALTKLFNLILRSNKFPEKWNTNIQSIIYKSGNTTDCNNYRGISITSCLGKLFTSVLHSRLLSYLEDNNKISDKQAAFRPGFSTSDHLFTLRALINKHVKVDKKKLYVCFIDFRKAYDKVLRNGLFLKLLKKRSNRKLL